MSRLAEPVPLHLHAATQLRYIRDTMARAAEFTAVPGWGGVGMGAVAIVTACVAGSPAVAPEAWLVRWLVAAGCAAAIGVAATLRKMRRFDVPVRGATVRRFSLTFVPSLLAGAVLTAVLADRRLVILLPGCWLLTYGAAMTSAGVYSVRPVRAMGVCFMVLGAAAFVMSPAWANVLMAMGFGVLQIGFGIRIGRRYGG